MIKRKIKTHAFVITLLIFIILFYGYYIQENKGSININSSKTPDKRIERVLNNGVTKFEDVEYKSTDEKNRNYITRGKEALLYKDNPNMIELTTVHSFTKLKDGSILNVRSKKAKYFKNSKNINYYEGVVITNKNKTIKSKKANFFSDKNKITLEGDVLYKDIKNIITGDLAEFNTLNNNLKIIMNKKKEKVYGQTKR